MCYTVNVVGNDRAFGGIVDIVDAENLDAIVAKYQKEGYSVTVSEEI